jgi:hypothetical protein
MDALRSREVQLSAVSDEDEGEEVDPAIAALEARRAQERDIRHVSLNLERSRRVRAPSAALIAIAQGKSR